MRTFRDFMEEALYDPGRGFYARRIPAADFYTAPELHPAFAAVLARQILKRLEALKGRGARGPYALVEMGSGSGRLAQDLLSAIARESPPWRAEIRYVLVERCADLLRESLRSLAARHPDVTGHARLEDLAPCAGVFLSNELVDSLPVHLLQKHRGDLREVCVEESGREGLCALSRPELKPHAEAVAPGLGEAERHAVSLEALRWLGLVSERLREGFVITIDYGKRFPAGQANAPRSYVGHWSDGRVTAEAGRRDITAPVDFEALIRAGEGLGLSLDSYTTLSRFLLDGGIADWLALDGSLEDYRSRLKVKTLLHPEGMGEAFKVLVQSKRSES